MTDPGAFFKIIANLLEPNKVELKLDRGCGSMVIVGLLTCIGWMPGVIAALVILNKNS